MYTLSITFVDEYILPSTYKKKKKSKCSSAGFEIWKVNVTTFCNLFNLV